MFLCQCQCPCKFDTDHLDGFLGKSQTQDRLDAENPNDIGAGSLSGFLGQCQNRGKFNIDCPDESDTGNHCERKSQGKLMQIVWLNILSLPSINYRLVSVIF